MTTTNTAGSHDADVARRLAEYSRRTEILRAVIESISGDLALEPLLTRMIESATTLLGAEHGAIGLVIDTHAGPAIRQLAIHNFSPHEPVRDLPPGAGFGARVLKERGPVRLERYAQLDRPVRSDINDHTMLGVPIWWGDRITGYIGVGAPPPHTFDEEAVETLVLFGQHAAIAVEIARRFEDERRRAVRTGLLNHIGRLITSSLSLGDVLRTAVTALAEHLHYPHIALMLVDPDDPEVLRPRMRAGVYTDEDLGEYRQSIYQGIAGAAAVSRRPVLVNDARNDPRYIPIKAGGNLNAELAVPLAVGDRLIGVLNIESEHPIAEEDAADFEIAAVQLAIAIDNARLFAETAKALDETRLLYETSRRISTAIDVDEVVEAYLEQVAARRQFICHVVLYEFDDDGCSTGVVVRGRWSPRDGIVIMQTRLPLSRDAFDADLDQGQVVTIADYTTDPRVSDEFRRTQRQRHAPKALAMIPLMVGRQRTGLIILSSRELRDWYGVDLHPYQLTAAQLAAAIDNRRQYRLVAERGRRLAVLQERQRLARELHDAVTQSVFSVSLIAQSIVPALKRDPAQAEHRIERLIEQSLAAMTELRAVLAELRPDDNRNADEAAGDPIGGGLVVALARLAAGLDDHGLAADLDADTYVPQIQAHERALYRIAQESLSNVVKHARARRVSLRLSTTGDRVRFRIADDGIGLTMAVGRKTTGPPQPGSGGLGMTSMRERVAEIGGSLQMNSLAGGGTTIDVILPRRDEQP
ncbi:MAG: GAF domain-containing protein [Dehalococcoidia bacterium]